ncbi:MAG: hypothetical protein EXS47_00900 [Candidatus Zambryskibacteria bacterium]|nr:hypothetical protein [Candidatus Zambryskibacteria bacterium]
MEPKFQTSFIPKKPIVSQVGSGIEVIRSTNIFSVIATVMFLVTVIISGGLFVYKKVLSGQIDQGKKDVAAADEAIDSEKIKELIDANSRIISSKKLLDNHIASSEILLLLQDITIKRMRFTELTYKNTDKEINLNIKGEVQTYNALAQQEVIFKQNEFFKNPQFSGLALAENGTVSIEFSTMLDPFLISYKKALESLPLDQ